MSLPTPDEPSTGPYADHVTLAGLFTERYAELTRLAYVLTGDANLAEDLAQDAFVRAWPKLDRLRSADAAPAYLRTTLVNLVRQRFRRRLVERRHPPPLPEPVPPPDDDRSTALDLAQLVRTLPLRRRACVVLRYYADMSEEETAATLGISVGTVKSQTHRGLRQLAQELERGRDHERAQAIESGEVTPIRGTRTTPAITPSSGTAPSRTTSATTPPGESTPRGTAPRGRANLR